MPIDDPTNQNIGGDTSPASPGLTPMPTAMAQGRPQVVRKTHTATETVEHQAYVVVVAKQPATTLVMCVDMVKPLSIHTPRSRPTDEGPTELPIMGLPDGRKSFKIGLVV